jgi:hypothetical protein
VTGWLEAFAAHPKIGDLEGLRKKFGGFAELSKGEQAAAAGASEGVLQVRSRGVVLGAALHKPPPHMQPRHFSPASIWQGLASPDARECSLLAAATA